MRLDNRNKLSRLFCTLLALTPWCAQSAPGTKEPLRVGLIFPLTGSSSDMGHSARVGAQIATDQINRFKGGFLGRPIELVVRDDQSNPELGLQHAQDLVLKEKVVATVGFCNSGVALKSLEVFQTNKHVLIVPCATGSPITSKYPAAQSYVFRTSPRDELQSKFVVNEAVKRGLTKIGLLVDTTGYGDVGLKDLEAALAAANLKPHAVVRFKVGAENLDAEVKQLKDSGANAMISWSVGREQGLVAASRTGLGWKVLHLGPWSLAQGSALSASGGKVDGAVMVQTVLPNLSFDRNSEFVRAYGKLSTEQPIGSMMSAAQAHDSVHLLIQALEQTKSDISGPAIKKALENQSVTYRGVVTSYNKVFSDKDHDAISDNMLWLGTWRGQERAYYYKEDEKRSLLLRYKK
jgi:branched-chain amino acid transport system substrate-binding protein